MTSQISIARDRPIFADRTDLEQYTRTSDAAAFGRLVRGHIDLVYSVCRHELRDEASLADDATQAVFILLAQRPGRVGGPHALVGWLYTTARNCSRNARRASLRRRRHELEAAKQRTHIMQAETSASAERAELEASVHQALSRLNAPQRELLLMRFFQRLSLVEVGRAVGVSEDAARQRVNRAIGALRSIMERGRGRAMGTTPAILLATPAWLESHAVIPTPTEVMQAALNIGAAAIPRSSSAGAIAQASARTFTWTATRWAAVVCIFATGLVAAIATSQPTTAPGAASGAAPTSQPAAPLSVTVRALIDGRDHLILKGATACWRHLEFAAPGLHGGRNEPTTINGIAWRPVWDDSDMDKEVRVQKSMSDKFEQINPPLPAAPMLATLQKIHCRGAATILQQPSADNDFTTIVEFDDNSAAGVSWYEVKVTFSPFSSASPTTAPAP